MLSDAQKRVYAMRSELDKVGVPTDRRLAPPDLLTALDELVADGKFEWIDRYFNIELWLPTDVYQMTAAGRAALDE